MQLAFPLCFWSKHCVENRFFKFLLRRAHSKSVSNARGSLSSNFGMDTKFPAAFFIYFSASQLRERTRVLRRIGLPRTKNRIFNRFSLLHLEHRGGSSLSKFPRYSSFMSRTLKRNMNGLRAPVRYTPEGK